MQSNESYAGLGRRFWALVIDGLLFCAVFVPITRVVKGVWIMSATDPLCVAFLALMVLYFVLLDGLVGAALGK
jgi:hypothetical protein